MKKKIGILVIEDEPEVRQAILRDLRAMEEGFVIESAGEVPEAEEVLQEFEDEGILVGLIISDHRLPGESGVDFLTRLHGEAKYRAIRKILLTGQANHEDTIRAVNEAGLNHYLAKPWEPGELVSSVRDQLTEFVLGIRDLELMPFLGSLDAPRLLAKMAEQGGE